MQESKDGLLLGAFLKGDSSAFDLIVERYQGPLIRFARGFVRDRGAAEDLVQETFIRLIRSTPDIGSDGVLGPWLYRVCRNLAYDNSKMETREMKRRERAVVPEPPPSPDGHSEQQETCAILRRELHNLPEREREALRLKVDQGLSYKQIAEVLGVKAGTVGWLVHQAMNHLTDRLRAAEAI
ncbi:MAG: RNA polymerase sigma factor [Planctomycetes bacterium]|nr:RNA polymerase sigma factor [Planctomycetota bacterium]